MLAQFKHAVNGETVYINPAHVAAIYRVKAHTTTTDGVEAVQEVDFTEVLLSCGQAMPIKDAVHVVVRDLRGHAL